MQKPALLYTRVMKEGLLLTNDTGLPSNSFYSILLMGMYVSRFLQVQHTSFPVVVLPSLVLAKKIIKEDFT